MIFAKAKGYIMTKPGLAHGRRTDRRVHNALSIREQGVPGRLTGGGLYMRWRYGFQEERMDMGWGCEVGASVSEKSQVHDD